jgi:hypothetical protein
MSILLRAAVSFLTVVGGLFIVPAGAASVCKGSYTASSIRSLPQPATIELGITRSDPANLRLAEVFADGLRRAGVTVSPSGNARLGLSFLIHEKRGARALQHVDFAWMDHLPSQVGSATMALTVMLVGPQDAAFLWVGSVECVIQTTSKEALTRYLGEVIGRDLGKSATNRMI